MQRLSDQIPGSWGQSTVPCEAPATRVPRSWGQGKKQHGMESFVCFWSRRTGRRTVAGGGDRARGMREAPLAVRIRHRDRRTRGTTLSLQGPHGGDTANTILNNPAGRTDRRRVRDGSGAPLAPRTPHQEKELVLLLSCFQQTPGLGWETHGNWSGRTDILFERLRVS